MSELSHFIAVSLGRREPEQLVSGATPTNAGRRDAGANAAGRDGAQRRRARLRRALRAGARLLFFSHSEIKIRWKKK